MKALRPPTPRTNVENVLFEKAFLLAPNGIRERFPCDSYERFPACYCGAGNGFQEYAIPDYIFRWSRLFGFLGLDISIKLSPACFIHDWDWYYAQPDEGSFAATNERLSINLGRMIDAYARWDFVRDRARYRAITYWNAVDEFGEAGFWNLKMAQGHKVPLRGQKFIDPGMVAKMAEELWIHATIEGQLL